MDTFVCRKCKSECEATFEDDDHPFFPTIWCDKCDDNADVPNETIMDMEASAMGDAIDRAHDEQKDRQMWEANQKKE